MAECTTSFKTLCIFKCLHRLKVRPALFQGANSGALPDEGANASLCNGSTEAFEAFREGPSPSEAAILIAE
jgi:hypothetical protein